MCCMLCIEIIKQKITLPETLYAMKEFTVPEEHKAELVKTIEDTFGTDNVIDALWEQYYYEGAD